MDQGARGAGAHLGGVSVRLQREQCPGAGTGTQAANGFPRTVPQAGVLAAMLGAAGFVAGFVLDAVLEFTAPEEAVARLLGRGRPDDTEDVIRHRQRVYQHQTAPLLTHYSAILLTVDAVGPVEDITARALAVLSDAERRAG
ncbi:nucleoside monophosphate kinase [Streptomyces sp. NPDC050743]|uniref:nucleoside monophosphate kinase n=1 Tax=Streptomyces sp. NPDC050743 TaxID=3365634 RepID=UPI0037B6D663